jgi:RES domain-containing protein
MPVRASWSGCWDGSSTACTADGWPVIVWRLTREPYRALDGEGARLYGGRWNSEGVAVVYASTTLALAALEYLVHLDPIDVPRDLLALRLRVPDDATGERIETGGLPADWREVPDHLACVRLGDAWAVRGDALTLHVPSAIVPEEENVLINPHHPEAGRVELTADRPFAFDPRLFR